MTDLTEGGDIPSPEALAKKQLVSAPLWLQRLTSNALAVLAWIGLPSTVISTLSDVKSVLGCVQWLYAHSGAAQPVLLAIGHAISFAVGVWRYLTHPIWRGVAEWLHITLPAWAPDVLTLAALIALGLLRRGLRVAWGEVITGGHMYGGALPTFGRPEDKIAIPRTFPYEEHFAECGVKWTPAKLRDARELWRKWRRNQVRAMLAYDGRYWPKFHKDVICAEFERYWLSITEGRRDMLVYATASGVVMLAFVIDWLWRLPH